METIDRAGYVGRVVYMCPIAKQEVTRILDKSSRGTHYSLYATEATAKKRAKEYARRQATIYNVQVISVEVLKVQLHVLDKEEIKPCGN